MSKILSRSVIINNYLIITNYKCGFSSLSHIEEALPIKNYKESKQLKNIIFIYRDIYLRNISVFLNWCIRRLNFDSWLNNILKEKLGKKKFKKFKKLIKKNNIIKAYKIFLKKLKEFKQKNQHLHSQIIIFDKFRLADRNPIFINLDNKNDVIKMENIIDRKIPIYNESSNNDKEILFKFLKSRRGFWYRKILDRLYYDDIALFKANSLCK